MHISMVKSNRLCMLQSLTALLHSPTDIFLTSLHNMKKQSLHASYIFYYIHKWTYVFKWNSELISAHIQSTFKCHIVCLNVQFINITTYGRLFNVISKCVVYAILIYRYVFSCIGQFDFGLILTIFNVQSERRCAAQWHSRLTRNVSVVGSSPIKGPRCVLEQETVSLLLSTGWFQERII